MGGTSEILKVHKMSFGVGHGIPYTIRVYGIFYLHLEMVREICHTWMLGIFPGSSMLQRVWQLMWDFVILLDVYRPFKTLFWRSIEPLAQKGSLTINQDGFAHGTDLLLFFFGVVPSLGRWNLMQHFELVIQFESNSWGVIEDFNRFKPSQLKKSPFKMARCWCICLDSLMGLVFFYLFWR